MHIAAVALPAAFVATIYLCSYAASPREWRDRDSPRVLKARAVGLLVLTALLLWARPPDAAVATALHVRDVLATLLLLVPLCAAHALTRAPAAPARPRRSLGTRVVRAARALLGWHSFRDVVIVCAA